MVVRGFRDHLWGLVALTRNNDAGLRGRDEFAPTTPRHLVDQILTDSVYTSFWAHHIWGKDP